MPFEPDAPTPSFVPEAGDTKPTPSFQPEPTLGLKAAPKAPPTPSFKPEVGIQSEPYPGNYQEHGQDPVEQTSLGEDARRIGEAVTNLPQTLGRAAWSLAETATDLPLRQMAIQHFGPEHRSDGLKTVLDNQGIRPAQPGQPGFLESFLHHSLTAETVQGHLQDFERTKLATMPPEQQQQFLADKAKQLNMEYGYSTTPPLDAAIPNSGGVTARQAINKTVDATIGRTTRFAQWLVGKPASELLAGASKLATPMVEANPATQMARELGLIAKNGPEDDYGTKQWLELSAGQGYVPPEGSTEEVAYHKRLVQMYGPIGSAIYQGAVSLGKQWPVFFLPGTEARWAGASDRALAEDIASLSPRLMKASLPVAEKAVKSGVMKQNIASAATQTAYMSAMNKEDFLSSMEEGTVAGAFLALLHVPSAKKAFARSASSQLKQGQTGWSAELLDRPNAPNTRVDQAVGAAVVAPAKSIQALGAELDAIIACSSVKKVPKGTADALKLKAEYADRLKAEQQTWDRTRSTTGAMDTTNVTTPGGDVQAVPGSEMGMADPGPRNELDLDVKPGKVYTPSYSKLAINAEGKPVLRKVQLLAGQGASTPSALTTKNPRSGQTAITAHSKNASAVYEDHPLTSYENAIAALNKNASSLNLATMSDAEMRLLSRVNQHIAKTNLDLSVDSPLGTPNFMAPETYVRLADMKQKYKPSGPDDAFFQDPKNLASPRDEELARRVIEAWDAKQGQDQLRKVNAGKVVVGKSAGGTDLLRIEPTASVATVAPDRTIRVTPVRPPEPRPLSTRQIKVGDYVMADGRKGYVEGRAANGDVLLRDPSDPKKFLSHPIEDTFLADLHEPPLHSESPTELDPRTTAFIKASTKVTIPDVMKWSQSSVKDMGWVTDRLHDMEANGELRRTGPGEWEPTNRKAATNKDIDEAKAKGGQLVYYATGGTPTGSFPTGSGKWGVLRGPDTRTKGNWLIEVPDESAGMTTHPMSTEPVYKNTKFLSVPENEVRTKWPVMMADKSKVNPDIDAFGWTKPMPPQFIAKAPIDEIQKMTDAWSKISKPGVRGAINAKGDAAWNALVGAMHQADPLIRTSNAQKAFSASHVMRSEAIAMNDRLEGILGGAGSAANQELTQVLESHRARSPNGTSQGINPQDLYQWAQKYPKEFAASFKDIKEMVALSDQYQKTLADRGVGDLDVKEFQRANDLIPEYLTRNYAAFQMPRREWAEYARKNLTQEWHNALKYLRDNNPQVADDVLVGEVDRIMKLENPIKGFQDAGYIKADSKAKLTQREDVPAPIRALLGEHKDASMRLAFTLAHQRQLVKGIEAFDAIAAHPDLWSPGRRADMTLQVPDHPLFGNARNGWVNDNEATRLIVEGAKLHSSAEAPKWLQRLGWLGQKWKTGHTVYNQSSIVANMVRNLKGVALSPWDSTGYSEAANMLMNYHEDPTVYGRNKVMVEAMDFGALGPGLAGAELGAAQRKLQRKIFSTFATHQGPVMDAFDSARDALMSVPEGAHAMYDSIDRVAKLGSYLNWRRKFIASGMSIDDAAALSSLRVNELFPNYTGTPQWARNTFGSASIWAGLGPWATSKLEDTRINGNIAKNLVGSLMPPSMRPKYHDPELVWRMLALSAGIGGAATLALNTRRMNGISDAQDLLERSQIPINSQKYSHLLIGSLDYDEHGRRTFYPVDTYEDLAMTLSGNLGDHPVARSVVNNFLDVVGPDSVQGLVTQQLAGQAGIITPVQPPNAPRADQTGLLNTALKYGPGILPQAPFKAAAAYNAMDPSGRMVNPEALTGNQALQQGLGLGRPFVVGPQTHTQTLMETAHNVGQKAKDIGAAATDAALQGVSSDRQKYMIESNVRALKKSINIPRPLNKPGTQGGSK